MKFRFAISFIMVLATLNVMAQKNKTAAAPVKKDAAPAELVWLDWNEGYEKAVKTGKIVLVDAYTDWCGWCKKMDRDTYTKPEIISKINADFIPVKFNPEITDRTYKLDTFTMSGRELYGLFTQGNSTGFPTTYFIFPSKKRIMLEPGYKGPDDFNVLLDHIVGESKK